MTHYCRPHRSGSNATSSDGMEEEEEEEQLVHTSIIWGNLCQWVEQHGGYVHPALHLATMTTMTSTSSAAVAAAAGGSTAAAGSAVASKEKDNAAASSSAYRGVFCQAPIATGEILIRLPAALALSGRDLPARYRLEVPAVAATAAAAATASVAAAPASPHRHGHRPMRSHPPLPPPRVASPWLRCLAAYYQSWLPPPLRQQQQTLTLEQQFSTSSTFSSSSSKAASASIHGKIDFTPYHASLPAHYETIWQWSRQDVDRFLVGTTPPMTMMMSVMTTTSQPQTQTPPNSQTNTDGATTTTATNVAATTAAGSSSSSAAGEQANSTQQQQQQQQHSHHGWYVDPAVMHDNYQQRIRPYLVHCQVLAPQLLQQQQQQQQQEANNIDTKSLQEEQEFQDFAYACQTISTRAFHLSSSSSSSPSLLSMSNHRQQHHSRHQHHHHQHDDHEASSSEMDHHEFVDDDYHGPFLLPVIDLLNHAATPREICTTLQRHEDVFLMIAERDLEAGQEVLHSYGRDLTASQCLQTFGFVSHNDIAYAATAAASVAAAVSPAADATNTAAIGKFSSGENDPVALPPVTLTPAVVSTQAVLEACWNVLESDQPRLLAQQMHEQDMEDDIWTMPTDYRKRDTSFLPDWLVVSPADPLPETLVTAASLSFLPMCAYREAVRAFLDPSLLQDYYLGKLVGAALLQVVTHQLQRYQTSSSSFTQQQNQDPGDPDPSNSESTATTTTTAVSVLAQTSARIRALLEQQSATASAAESVSRQRELYGLTVQWQEQASLEALRRHVLSLLAQLDQDEVDHYQHQQEQHQIQDSQPEPAGPPQGLAELTVPLPQPNSSGTDLSNLETYKRQRTDGYKSS